MDAGIRRIMQHLCCSSLPSPGTWALPRWTAGCEEKCSRDSRGAVLLGKTGLPVMLTRSQAGKRNCSLGKSCVTGMRRNFVTWADGLRVGRGRHSNPAPFWSLGCSGAGNASYSPFLREYHGSLQTRVNHNGKGGVPSRDGGARLVLWTFSAVQQCWQC